MKFWVCVNNEISGPLEPADAVKVPGFTLFAWACRDMAGGRADEPRAWKRAISFPEMAACFFPNYPPPAEIAESPEPAAQQPSAELDAGPVPQLPPVPPAPPRQRMALEPDSELMREINRKLDDLLARRAAAPQSGEPLVNELRRAEMIMAKRAGGSGQAVHKELEPLSRKLDLAEKTFSEMKSGLDKEALHLEIEPLTRTLAVTEKAVEDIRRDMEDRLGGELGPLKTEMELAEKAIEAEDARIALFRQEVVERIAALETSLKEFRVELASGRAIAEAETLMRQPPPASGGSSLPLLAAALAAGVLLAALALFRKEPSPGPVKPAASAPAAPEPEAKPALSVIDFAQGYRLSAGGPTLAAAIGRDAAARGGIMAAARWEPEKVSDSYYRLLVLVPRSGGSLPYYFAIYPAEGRARALNKAGRRALDLLAAPVPEKL